MLEKSRKFQRGITVANFLKELEDYIQKNGHKGIRPIFKSMVKAKTNREKFKYYEMAIELIRTV